jgi:hypothetical protein
MRSKLGLSGNLRAKAIKSGRKPTSSGKLSQTNSRSRQLADLDSDVDRLIFKAMQIGGLDEIEGSLSRCGTITSAFPRFVMGPDGVVPLGQYGA